MSKNILVNTESFDLAKSKIETAITNLEEIQTNINTVTQNLLVKFQSSCKNDLEDKMKFTQGQRINTQIEMLKNLTGTIDIIKEEFESLDKNLYK